MGLHDMTARIAREVCRSIWLKNRLLLRHLATFLRHVCAKAGSDGFHRRDPGGSHSKSEHHSLRIIIPPGPLDPEKDLC